MKKGETTKAETNYGGRKRERGREGKTMGRDMLA